MNDSTSDIVRPRRDAPSRFLRGWLSVICLWTARPTKRNQCVFLMRLKEGKYPHYTWSTAIRKREKRAGQSLPNRKTPYFLFAITAAAIPAMRIASRTATATGSSAGRVAGSPLSFDIAASSSKTTANGLKSSVSDS